MITLLDGRHVLNLPAIQNGLKAAIAREADLVRQLGELSEAQTTHKFECDELRAENERLRETCWKKPDSLTNYSLETVLANLSQNWPDAYAHYVALQKRAENAEQRNTELEAQIRLHAGDTISLTNELNEWRDRANAAEAAGAQSVRELAAWKRAVEQAHGHSIEWSIVATNIKERAEQIFSRGDVAAPSAPAQVVPFSPTLKSKHCEWYEVGEMWETTCGHAFVLNYGTPSENEMRFCCYCGGELTAPVAENAEKDGAK